MYFRTNEKGTEAIVSTSTTVNKTVFIKQHTFQALDDNIPFILIYSLADYNILSISSR